MKREELFILSGIWHILILPNVELHHDGSISSTFILVFRVVQSRIKSPFKCNGKFLYVAESRLIYNFS